MKYGFQGPRSRVSCGLYAPIFSMLYTIHIIICNILKMPNTHKNHWIILLLLLLCVRTIPPNGRRKCKRASTRWKKNIWSPRRPVSRAHARASHQATNKKHICRFWKLYYYISCIRVGDWWSVWVRISCTFYIITYYMPTIIRVIRSTWSKSTCRYKYTRDNDHRSVVDVVTRAVYYV